MEMLSIRGGQHTKKWTHLSQRIKISEKYEVHANCEVIFKVSSPPVLPPHFVRSLFR